MARNEGGLTDIQIVQVAERDLALAKLETSAGKEERLDHIREAFESTLKTWQRVYELGRNKRRGSEPDSEGAARAALFLYRIMWLKENSIEANVPGEPKQAVPPKEDFSEQLWTGKSPDGLVGVFDLNALERLRMEAASQSAKALWDRYMGGLTYISFLIDALEELANAQLDSKSDPEQRLKYMSEALNASIDLWRRTEELKRVGRRGGEPDQVSLAKAAVLRYRAMLLKEEEMPKKADNGVQCKIRRSLPVVEAIAIIEIDRLAKFKDFTHISAGLNTTQFAKKVGFSASPEWAVRWKSGPIRFFAILELRTRRLTIIKLQGDSEWYNVCEGPFDDEEVSHHINTYCKESGHSDFLINRLVELDLFKMTRIVAE
ncbi:hypothetical protein VN12_00105 [Pirellula sp. SH-Sr6A]|uniref:hypothetical protein n=1 Tax=Pirellula sp. SH-Sr6A TaxID=1632865 RepID=UPI00078D7015|nr:hypothetical protein [Pirellula sp. SH-Sr6A]AMV30483.1 hypothetical protein VN12_00105 [Pirellula sp. SH-Sr6A]